MKLATYLIAALSATAIGAGLAVAQNDALPLDTPTVIDGVETVCTGSALETRDDPQWRSYPFRLEFVGRGGQYLGEETVSVSGNGHSVTVQCKGPWVLMKLPRGTYRVDSEVADAGHKGMTVRSPGHAIVRFQNAGGGLSPPEPRVAYR